MFYYRITFIYLSLFAIIQGNCAAISPTQKNANASPVVVQDSSSTNTITQAAIIAAGFSSLAIASAVVYAAKSFGSSTKSINHFVENSPVIMEKMIPLLVKQVFEENEKGNPEEGMAAQVARAIDHQIGLALKGEKAPEMVKVLEENFPELDHAAASKIIQHLQTFPDLDRPELLETLEPMLKQAGIDEAKIPEFLHHIKNIQEKSDVRLVPQLVQKAVKQIQGGDHPEMALAARLQQSLEKTVVPSLLNTLENKILPQTLSVLEEPINLFLRGENHRNEIVNTLKSSFPEMEQETYKALYNHIKNHSNPQDPKFKEKMHDLLKSQYDEEKISAFIENVKKIQNKPLDPLHQKYVKEILKNVTDTTQIVHQRLANVKLHWLLGRNSQNTPKETILYKIGRTDSPKELAELFLQLQQYIKEEALETIKDPEVKLFITHSSQENSSNEDVKNHPEIQQYIAKYHELSKQTQTALEKMKKSNLKEHQEHFQKVIDLTAPKSSGWLSKETPGSHILPELHKAEKNYQERLKP